MKLEVENIPETSPFPNQSFALRDQTYEAFDMLKCFCSWI